MKDRTGARVVIHREEAENISRGDLLDAPPTRLKGRIFSVFLSLLVMGGTLSPSKPVRPIFAYDLEEVEKSLKKLLTHDVEIRRFYAAHGGPFSREEVEGLIG